MTNSKKFLAAVAAIVAATATLTSGAVAAPHPYEREKDGGQKVERVVQRANSLAHSRRIPRPGADGTNRLCDSPSKARRIAC